MNPCLLDQSTCDLCVDPFGNWALASAPYAIAQDVASAIRTFLGEVWYNNTLGIPYFTAILGELPPVGIFQAYMVGAALTVPFVVANPAPVCTITSFQQRNVVGSVTFTDSAGNSQTVQLA